MSCGGSCHWTGCLNWCEGEKGSYHETVGTSWDKLLFQVSTSCFSVRINACSKWSSQKDGTEAEKWEKRMSDGGIVEIVSRVKK